VTYAHRRAGLVDARAVRIFNSYGPRMAVDDGRVVTTFLVQALTGQALTVAGDGGQSRSLCFAPDTARGLLRAALTSHPGPFNIGSDHEVTVAELASLVRQVCDSDSPLLHVDLPQDDPRVRRPDLSRTRAELGWQAEVPLLEGLRRTAHWLRTSGALRRAPEAADRVAR
jgi:dTDP-glucose 4,6-dehydratase